MATRCDHLFADRVMSNSWLQKMRCVVAKSQSQAASCPDKTEPSRYRHVEQRTSAANAVETAFYRSEASPGVEARLRWAAFQLRSKLAIKPGL